MCPFLTFFFVNDQNSPARLLRYGISISTESNHVDEPHKLEEAETIRTPPPPLEKVTLFCLILFDYVCKPFF